MICVVSELCLCAVCVLDVWMSVLVSGKGDENQMEGLTRERSSFYYRSRLTTPTLSSQTASRSTNDLRALETLWVDRAQKVHEPTAGAAQASGEISCDLHGQAKGKARV